MKVQANPVIEQNQNQNYKKPSVGKKVLATAAAVPVSGAVTFCVSQGVSRAVFNKFSAAGSANNADEFKSISEGAEKILNDTGLAEKGVKTVNNASSLELRDMITKAINSDPISKYLPNILKQMQINNAVNQISSGKNAAYFDAAKTVILPNGKSLALTIFHELGHAANANLSKSGRVLQKCRCATFLTIPITLIALLRTKKAPNDKHKGGALDFIKNNAGKLTFLTFIPMLAEEAMASVKGLGFAKKVLSPDLVKRTAKTYKLAYLTYLGVATGVSAGMAAATKVHDAIAHPKIATAENK